MKFIFIETTCPRTGKFPGFELQKLTSLFLSGRTFFKYYLNSKYDGPGWCSKSPSLYIYQRLCPTYGSFVDSLRSFIPEVPSPILCLTEERINKDLNYSILLRSYS